MTTPVSSRLDLRSVKAVQRRAARTRRSRSDTIAELVHAGIILVHAGTIAEGDRGGELRALDRLPRDHPGPTDLRASPVWLEPAG